MKNIDKYSFYGNNIFSIILNNKKINIDNILNELFLHKSHYLYSHFICKRWENIYLQPNLVPSVLPILSESLAIAKNIYEESFIIPHELFGFSFNEYWFNIANPGESTGVHNHKKKSKVSGVFYLQIPKNSGNLNFKSERSEIFELKPKTGKLVLFPSKLNHFVTKNKSDEQRISLAFNCFTYPFKDDIVISGYEKNNFFPM